MEEPYSAFSFLSLSCCLNEDIMPGVLAYVPLTKKTRTKPQEWSLGCPPQYDIHRKKKYTCILRKALLSEVYILIATEFTSKSSQLLFYILNCYYKWCIFFHIFYLVACVLAYTSFGFLFLILCPATILTDHFSFCKVFQLVLLDYPNHLELVIIFTSFSAMCIF